VYVLKVEGHLGGQVALAVARHHLLAHVVQLDVLDVEVVLVVLNGLVHLLVRVDAVLEVLQRYRGSQRERQEYRNVSIQC
jgi:hypothetical protein